MKFVSFHLFSKPPGIYHPTIFRSWELFSSPPWRFLRPLLPTLVSFLSQRRPETHCPRLPAPIHVPSRPSGQHLFNRWRVVWYPINKNLILYNDCVLLSVFFPFIAGSSVVVFFSPLLDDLGELVPQSIYHNL